MSSLPIRRQLVVPAGPEVAFTVFVAGIGEWWPLDGHSVYGAGGSVGIRDGHLVEVGPDGTEAVWGRVLVNEPPRLLRLTWHPGRAVELAGEVEVRFAAVDDGHTLVTLEHRGWERYADPAAARANYLRGWPVVLGRFGSATGSATPATEDDGAVWLALMHTPGPAAGPDGRIFGHPNFPRHLDFLRSLAADGVLVAAGSLDGAGEGMTVVRRPGAAAAAALVIRAQDEDGSVTGELLQVRVRPWAVALTG